MLSADRAPFCRLKDICLVVRTSDVHLAASIAINSCMSLPSHFLVYLSISRCSAKQFRVSMYVNDPHGLLASV
ncbi:hypothetical protein MSAN_01893800 [Mycena sanguinolenta]|uniref:Uncharacterized protein n=1 Tax=Mycena sanguinolenta TaxID=230812 RepID=A0A8H7CPB9_9AGAR|nr:hypothetical protein MSAN_01893800 [Mycena sanguinolenta]